MCGSLSNPNHVERADCAAMPLEPKKRYVSQFDSPGCSIQIGYCDLLSIDNKFAIIRGK